MLYLGAEEGKKKSFGEQPARIIMNGKGGRIQKKVTVDKQK